MQISGILLEKSLYGPNYLTIGDVCPIQALSAYTGQKITLQVFEFANLLFELSGVLEAFYFEGQDNYGTARITTDFYIDDTDVIEKLMPYVDKEIRLVVAF